MSVIKAIVNFLLTLIKWNGIRKDPGVNQVVVDPVNASTIYAVTATRRLGAFGFGLYLSSPVLILETEQEATAVRRILADYMRFSTVVITGTRSAIIKRVTDIGVLNFGNAISVKDHMTAQATRSVRKAVSDIVNPQSVFLMWLEGQVKKGNITHIDGYYFTDADPRAQIEGITPLEKFLPAYYNSYKVAARTFNLTDFQTIDIFARELQFRVTVAAMGITDLVTADDIFPKVNAMIKAHPDSPELEVVHLDNSINNEHIRALSRSVG